MPQGNFDPRGATFKVGDVLRLKCETLVTVEKTFGRTLVLTDSEGISRKSDIRHLYNRLTPWPWEDEIANPYTLLVPDDAELRGHYVYFVEHKGEIVYIGKGISNRYKHVTSGKSTSYFLNSLHFQGEEVDVYFFKEGLTDKEATELEWEMILKHQPKGNIIGVAPSPLADPSIKELSPPNLQLC